VRRNKGTESRGKQEGMEAREMGMQEKQTKDATFGNRGTPLGGYCLVPYIFRKLYS